MYNDFRSNACYTLTALLLKIQFGDSYKIDTRFKIAKYLMPLKFTVIDYEIDYKILDSELEKEINNVFSSIDFPKKKLRECLKKSMLNIIEINKGIVISPNMNNLIDNVVSQLINFLDADNQEKIIASKNIKINISKLPKYKYDESLYHVDNIIESSVIDNLNSYYRYTAELLNKEQKDEEKFIPIIAQIIGNYENAFSINENDDLFLLCQAISYYLDISMKICNLKIYSFVEIEKMIGD